MADTNQDKTEQAVSPPSTLQPQHTRSVENIQLLAPSPFRSLELLIPQPYSNSTSPPIEMDPPPPRRPSAPRPLQRVHATVPNNTIIRSNTPNVRPDIRSNIPIALPSIPFDSPIDPQYPYAGEINPFEGPNGITTQFEYTFEDFMRQGPLLDLRPEEFDSTGIGPANIPFQLNGVTLPLQFNDANVPLQFGDANSPFQFTNTNVPLQFNDQCSIINQGFFFDDEVVPMSVLDDAAANRADVDRANNQGDVFDLHREQGANYQIYGDNSAETGEHLRRLAVVSSIAASNARSEIKKGKKKAKTTENVQAPPREVPIVPMAKLAISHLKRLKDGKKKGKKDDDGKSDCHFCGCQDDFGVTDSNIWMEVDAFRRYCRGCHYSVQYFQREIEVMDPSYKAPPDAFDVEEAAIEAANPRPQEPPNTHISLIDKSDITPHMRILFCRGLAAKYAQVDPWKAKICDDCYDQKLAIIKHRHLEWSDIFKEQKPDEDQTQLNRCMVCIGIAVKKCAGCPLRLCTSCHCALVNSCKSYLNNLFYYYGRDHIRNDAFLLRGDGGGYQ